MTTKVSLQQKWICFSAADTIIIVIFIIIF